MAYRGQPLPPDHELWEACETGNIDRMRELFQTDNITANEAHWCLEELVSENVIGVDVVSCLLEHGADAKEFNFFCLKPCQSLEIFQLLAAHGLEFKEFGHLFLEDYVDNPPIIDFMLDQGANINETDTHRGTEGRSLPIAAGRRNHETHFLDKTLGVLNNAAALGDIKLFDHLVSRGANVSMSIALHNAARCKDPDRTKAMISHLVEVYGFDVNASDNADGLRERSTFDSHDDQGPPLWFAIIYDNLAAIESLLDHGANASLEGTVEWARITDAVPDKVKSLLESGADATSALSCAVHLKDLVLANLCLQRGGEPDIVLAKYEKREPGMTEGMKELLVKWKDSKLESQMERSHLTDLD